MCSFLHLIGRSVVIVPKKICPVYNGTEVKVSARLYAVNSEHFQWHEILLIFLFLSFLMFLFLRSIEKLESFNSKMNSLTNVIISVPTKVSFRL